jgi:hypothetical protein
MREKVVPGWATRLAMAFNALLVASPFLGVQLSSLRGGRFLHK